MKNQVIYLHNKGMSNKDIADKLQLNVETVRYHLGESTIVSYKPEIKDQEKRNVKIRELHDKKGKDYLERLYLMYLEGEFSYDRYKEYLLQNQGIELFY